MASTAKILMPLPYPETDLNFEICLYLNFVICLLSVGNLSLSVGDLSLSVGDLSLSVGDLSLSIRYLFVICW